MEQSREHRIYKVTIIGTIGNFLLLVFKFLAGFLGHSAAMVADAVHSLSDFATDLVVLLFVRLSSKPRDVNHDFGHGKYETLATAIIALSLFAVGLGIFWKGANEIWAFFNGQPLEAPGMIALWAALISIVVKELLYQYTVIEARKVSSKAMEANAWHHRSDAFSSIGTTLGIAGAIFLGEKGRVLDPVAAVVVSIFILRVAVQLVRPAIAELLEKSLPADTEQRIEEIIKATPGVSDPHNMRTRRIGNYAAVDVHVRMPAEMTVSQAHDITRVLETEIRNYLGKDTIINIHVEPIPTLPTD